MNIFESALRPLALGVAAFALAACDTVEFQSPPSLPLAACDPLLVGDWRAEDLRKEPDGGDLYLRISSDCERWHSIGIERDEQGKEAAEVDDLEEDLEIGFARSEKQAWIAARDRPDPGKESSPQDKPNGYTLVAWDRDGDHVVLRQVDLRAVSHLIVDDVVPGWIEKRDRRADGSRDAMASGFWVFVFGTPEETAALLDARDVLDAPWMRLKPVGADTSARIDAWIAAADKVADDTFESESRP